MKVFDAVLQYVMGVFASICIAGTITFAICFVVALKHAIKKGRILPLVLLNAFRVIICAFPSALVISSFGIEGSFNDLKLHIPFFIALVFPGFYVWRGLPHMLRGRLAEIHNRI